MHRSFTRDLLYHCVHRVCTGTLHTTCCMKIFSVSVELCAFCLVRGLIPSGFVKWNHGLIGKFTYKNQSALAGVAQC